MGKSEVYRHAILLLHLLQLRFVLLSLMLLSPTRLHWLNEMTSVSLRANDMTFSGALTACKMSGEWQQALQLMSRLRGSRWVSQGQIGSVSSIKVSLNHLCK